jgi:hypothetical protein
MNQDDVRKIVQLRKHLISQYQKLNNPSLAPNAIISEKDVAVILETTIRSLDDLISDKVNFS